MAIGSESPRRARLNGRCSKAVPETAGPQSFGELRWSGCSSAAPVPSLVRRSALVPVGIQRSAPVPVRVSAIRPGAGRPSGGAAQVRS
ncbi:hypothetical protein, partial [Nocardia cyriacigeorgica]|uniref:hypothetical protein n=1 Tax=Nocardia cyriacigeorgica TaxID=135487 RepID=UPI001C3F314B